MSTIPKDEVIEIATMSNGLQIWKIPNKEVGGFIYYSEENGAPLPALVEALISIECLEIILNDMKKTQSQLATDGREELENKVEKLKGMIEQAHTKGWHDFNDDEFRNIWGSWSDFKLRNNL